MNQPPEFARRSDSLAVPRDDLVSRAQAGEECWRIGIHAHHDQAIGITIVEHDAEIPIVVIIRFVDVKYGRFEIHDLLSTIAKDDHVDPLVDDVREDEAIKVLGALQPMAVDRNDDVSRSQSASNEDARPR